MLQRLATLLSVAGLVVTAACSQSDAGITTAVKAKLAVDPAVKAYQVNVETTGRIVTLSGTVESGAAKSQALSLARRTDGVIDVVDHLSVGTPAAATAGTIEDDLKAAGDATQRAAERSVDATKEALERTGEFVGDLSITAAVKSKLLGDVSAPGWHVDVDTKDGIVTLTGTVKSQADVDRAMAAARGTNGVKRVVSNLKISG